MTLKTTKIMENEIAKQIDFQYANRSSIENLSSFIKFIFNTTHSVVVGGTVRQLASASMNISIDPILGFNSVILAFSEISEGPYAIEASNTQDRIDIVQIKGEYVGFDTQQRAFNDPSTQTKTYADVEIKESVDHVVLIKKGVPGSASAPLADAGYIKIAEIKIRADTTQILTADICNITADLPGGINSLWTSETTSAFQMANIGELKTLFRAGHNSNGTHATEAIKASNIRFDITNDGVTTALIPNDVDITAPGLPNIPANTSLTTILQTLTTILAELSGRVGMTYQKTVPISVPYLRFFYVDLGIPNAAYFSFTQLKGINTKYVNHVALVCSSTYVDLYIYHNQEGIIEDGTPAIKWGLKKWGDFKYGESETIEVDLFFRKEA